MSNRLTCPVCGSTTALGQIKCFKCSYRPRIYGRNYLFDTVGIDKSQQGRITIPSDVVFNPSEFHIDALKWLYTYQVYKDTIIKEKIGYFPKWNRVFIPTFNQENKLAFYQLRDPNYKEDDQPKDGFNIKYLTFGNSKDCYSYFQHVDITNVTYKGQVLGEALNNHNRKLILVEDHLSYIRLKKFNDVMCLHGTYLPDSIIKELINNHTEIIFWLDADRPGQTSKNKILARMASIIQESWRTSSWVEDKSNDMEIKQVNRKNINKDPKCYTDFEIEYILHNELIELEL